MNKFSKFGSGDMFSALISNNIQDYFLMPLATFNVVSFYFDETVSFDFLCSKKTFCIIGIEI